MIETSDILPDQSGRSLGSIDQRWDVQARNLNVSGTVSGNFTALAIYKLTMQDVAWTAAPVFDATAVSSWKMVLAGNVTGAAFINHVRSQLYSIVIQQPPAGGFDFQWPASVKGGMAIGTGPNETSAQLFQSDGVNLLALAPGVIYT